MLDAGNAQITPSTNFPKALAKAWPASSLMVPSAQSELSQECPQELLLLTLMRTFAGCSVALGLNWTHKFGALDLLLENSMAP